MIKKVTALLQFDKHLFFYVSILSALGIFFAYSSNIRIGFDTNNIFPCIKQIFFFISGLGLMGLFSIISYRRLSEHAVFLYTVCILLLVYTFFFGKSVNNSQRWISIGIISIQPSEFVKIFMIIVIANYLDKNRSNMHTIRSLTGLGIIILVPILLIFLQPDLGTALVFIPVTISMLFISGMPLRYFFGIVLFGTLAAVIPIALTYAEMHDAGANIAVLILGDNRYLLLIAFFFLFIGMLAFLFNISYRNPYIQSIFFFCIVIFCGLIMALLVQNYLLKPYQRERILTFINPEADKWNLGYNVIQSQITIGSGGFTGKGFAQGAQGQLGFLPSRNTDFIFSVIGEELGFAGSFLILLIYFLFIRKLLGIAGSVKDYLGGQIVIGICCMFLVQIFVNIGMTIGLAPITGLPLPFLTSGGSTLWTSLMAAGIVMNIEHNKHVHAPQK